MFRLSFQSTFPHGERPENTWRDEESKGFNPRSRTGNDRSYAGKIRPERKFQSTFPHGERRAIDINKVARWLFQSTFPHGERQQSSTNFLCAFCSYLCNYTNKFRSTQPLTHSSSHVTSKLRCESPWNSMFTPDSHHSVVALPFIRNH